MNKTGKEAVVASLKSNFLQSEAAFFVGVQGLSVDQFSQLRKQLREKNARLQVAKVRLMKRALQDTQSIDKLQPYLQNQLGIVFADKDSTEVAKIICDFSKTVELLKVVAGSLNNNILDERSVKAIATLPSREILLAQVARALQAPTTNFVGVLHQLIARLVYVLKQIEQKKRG